MVIYYLLVAFSFIGFFIHLWISKKQKTAFRIVELLLLYQIFFHIGLTGFLAFIGFTFLPDIVAEYNGWPMSPYQQEMGNVNLAFGILGTLAIWFRGRFWTATCLGASIWLFADGLHHLYDLYFLNNASNGNTGILVYSDLLFPLLLLALLRFYHKLGNIRWIAGN